MEWARPRVGFSENIRYGSERRLYLGRTARHEYKETWESRQRQLHCHWGHIGYAPCKLLRPGVRPKVRRRVRVRALAHLTGNFARSCAMRTNLQPKFYLAGAVAT